MLNGRGNTTPSLTAVGQLDDKRNTDRLVIEKQPVFLLAVIAQSFAVIGQEHNGGPIVELPRLERFQESADNLVRVRNLTVVRCVFSKASGRRVRPVRLVD